MYLCIGLFTGGYDYLTNKIGNTASGFDPIEFTLLTLMGAAVGIYAWFQGLATDVVTPDYVATMLNVFIASGFLIFLEKLVKSILLKLGWITQATKASLQWQGIGK
jgi:hypothetical protein